MQKRKVEVEVGWRRRWDVEPFEWVGVVVALSLGFECRLVTMHARGLLVCDVITLNLRGARRLIIIIITITIIIV